MIDLEKIGENLERKGEGYETFKPLSLRRFTWEVHKLLFKVAIFAGVVAWVASHGH